MLIRGRLALVGVDQLTGGLDQPGDTLVAASRTLLGHQSSLQFRGLHPQWHPISGGPTLADAQEPASWSLLTPYRTRVGHDRTKYAATGEQATMNAHLSVVAQWLPPQRHRGDPDSRSSTNPPGSR